MLSRKQKLFLLKIVSMFSVVRGYNIPVIVAAQYLSGIFILSPATTPALKVVLDGQFFILVLASSLSVASGYIINNFYDSEKDLINRPNKSMLDRLVSQRTKLYVYFSLNFIVVMLAFLVSWRVALFYSAYIFAIWFYSHKLKKYAIIGNITASLLAIFPFFGILIYFSKKDQLRHFEPMQLEIIIAHATFLFLLLLIREMIKDLENIKGDFAVDRHTVPIIYGESASKRVITILVVATALPVYILTDVYEVGYMDIYFYCCLAALIFLVAFLWRANSRPQYLKLHNILKMLIIAGVISIVLIDPRVLIHGKNYLFIAGKYFNIRYSLFDINFNSELSTLNFQH